jgi:hypothetical protein
VATERGRDADLERCPITRGGTSYNVVMLRFLCLFGLLVGCGPTTSNNDGGSDGAAVMIACACDDASWAMLMQQTMVPQSKDQGLCDLAHTYWSGRQMIGMKSGPSVDN